MLNHIPSHEMKSLQPLARHDKIPKHKQDKLYAKLDKLCPARLIKEQWPDKPPGDCLPIVAEISSHFYRLVISVAKKRHGRGLTFNELFQEGCIGLFRGVFLFDNRKGYQISTYVTAWIHQAISRAISDQSRTIRIPPHISYSLSKINKTSAEHYKANGEWPTMQSIADNIDVSSDKARKFLAIDYITNTKSLDEKIITNGESSTLYDYCESDIDDYQCVEANELKLLFESALPHLNAKEERVLRMRFGLEPYKHPMTLKEIGDKFGLTRERARQIEKEAIEKLRKLDCVQELAEFL